jgi:hypothetical protein
MTRVVERLILENSERLIKEEREAIARLKKEVAL